jgi:hypothetical protein
LNHHECIRRTAFAALNPAEPLQRAQAERCDEKRRIPRRPAVSFDSVIRVASAEYLFMNVAMNAPRITKGE